MIKQTFGKTQPEELVMTTAGSHRIYKSEISGRKVVATEDEFLCFSKGDEGVVIGVDDDLDVLVEFESGYWFVTTHGAMRFTDGIHMIEFID